MKKKLPNIHLGIAYTFHKYSMEAIEKECARRKISAEYETTAADVTIMADCGCPASGPKRYNINHGYGSKNAFWIDNRHYNARERDNVTHLVPSQWFKERLEAIGRKCVVTGVPRLDAAVKTPAAELPFVAWCSTCHPELSSLNAFGRYMNRIVGSTDLMVVPSAHPVFTSLGSAPNPPKGVGVHCCRQSVLIAKSRVVIGDCATAPIDAIVLDKPAILYVPPNYEQTVNYNPENIEVLFADACYPVRTIEELISMLQMLSRGEDPKREARHAAAAKLLDYRGCAAKRVMDVIINEWQNS